MKQLAAQNLGKLVLAAMATLAMPPALYGPACWYSPILDAHVDGRRAHLSTSSQFLWIRLWPSTRKQTEAIDP